MKKLAFLLVAVGGVFIAGCSGGDSSTTPTGEKPVAPPAAGDNKGKAGAMGPDSVGVTDAGKNADSRTGSAGKGGG